MSKAYHISDTHLSFDANGKVIKPMHERKWAKGAWTYADYLQAMEKFAAANITEEDYTFITGDIGHDIKDIQHSLRWLRKTIKGTIVICRGNHDPWDVGKVRQQVADLPKFYLIDEDEILSIGPYMVGCFSNHAIKTDDFDNCDGRYLEMATNISKRAKNKNKVPVMLSHYPINENAAQYIGTLGIKAYLSGHVHCTATNEANNNGLNWKWYDLIAKRTDDLTFGSCYFSTATTDVVRAKHGQSFKEIKSLEIKPPKVKKPAPPKPPTKAPDREMIMLVGIPGSGKSTIAGILEKKGYVRINQDNLKTRKACETLTEVSLAKNLPVVIDRCNVNEIQRKPWIDIAKKFGLTKIKAVILDVSPDTCFDRACKRKNHPTITTTEIARKAVDNMYRSFKSPTQEEGFTSVFTMQEGTRPDVIVKTILEQTDDLKKKSTDS